MNRRQFVGSLGLGLIALGLNSSTLSFASDSPQVAITLDDFNWFDTPKMTAEARNRALLDALRSHSMQAAADRVAACSCYCAVVAGSDKGNAARKTRGILRRVSCVSAFG